MVNLELAKKYCCEDISKIENYEQAAASPETWDCHHRAEILPCGNFSSEDLKFFDLYYSRLASELVFLTKSDHHRLHAINMTKKWKNLLSKNAKLNGMIGKHHTENTKKKMSESHKGLPSPNKGDHFSHKNSTKKKKSESHKGKVWANNGVLTRQFPPDEIPPGWHKGRKLSL